MARPLDSPTPRFHTTRWSLVLAAGDRDAPQRAAALEDLCQAYWYPLYAYARRRGSSPESAQDVVQGFFAHLLAHEGIARADPERGKFRSFLLTSFRNFATNEAERASAKKRGGDARTWSLDTASAEQRFALEPTSTETPERTFERAWAVEVLRAALEELRDGYEAKGQGALFDAVKDSLTGARGGRAFGAIAEELDMSESAVKVAAHRLRGRYRQALRDHVEQTLGPDGDVEEELAALFAALAGG